MPTKRANSMQENERQKTTLHTHRETHIQVWVRVHAHTHTQTYVQMRVHTPKSNIAEEEQHKYLVWRSEFQSKKEKKTE